MINYFDQPRGKVTNNSVIAAWYFLRLWEATREERYLEHVGALLDFAASAQLPNGELPYIIGNQYEKVTATLPLLSVQCLSVSASGLVERLKARNLGRSVNPKTGGVPCDWSASHRCMR